MTDWKDPVTWGATAITDDFLNEQIRDNVMALKDPATASYAYSYSASVYATTTSTTWVAIDAAMSLSLEVFGGDILMVFSAAVSNALLDFAIDGQRLGGNDGILPVPTIATYGSSTRMLWLVQDLVAGTYDFDVYWKVASGTGNLFSFVPPQFIVREIS